MIQVLWKDIFLLLGPEKLKNSNSRTYKDFEEPVQTPK